MSLMDTFKLQTRAPKALDACKIKRYVYYKGVSILTNEIENIKSYPSQLA